MATMNACSSTPVHNNGSTLPSSSPINLTSLCQSMNWSQAELRAQQFPSEAIALKASSVCPLALSLRYSAPPSTIQSILLASPSQIRCTMGPGGTPLHEAASNPSIPLSIIKLLLSTDTSLAGKPSTLIQDVDGCTPLHILIRRIFSTSLPKDTSPTIAILTEFIQSCPSSCGIPDLREYEETPLILTLKASNFCPFYTLETEKLIYRIVKLMLKYHPPCITTAKLRYTPLHSAIFHGRCAEIVSLLIQCGGEHVYWKTRAEETALVFACMRGESERCLKVVTEMAGGTVKMKDGGGLYPAHWLWLRYVGTDVVRQLAKSYSSSSSSRDDHNTVKQRMRRLTLLDDPNDEEMMDYPLPSFDSFDEEYHRLTRAMDPPLDFRQMRHVPSDYLQYEKPCIQITIQTLLKIKQTIKQSNIHPKPKSILHLYQQCHLSQPEIIIGLFWNKILYLLNAIQTTSPFPLNNFPHNHHNGKKRRRLFHQSSSFTPLLHAASSTPCIPPAILQIAMKLHPNQLSQRDTRGKLPLHHAAIRPTHIWKLSSIVRSETTVMESTLDLVLEESPMQSSRTFDFEKRLPLHYAIDNLVHHHHHAACLKEDQKDAISFLRKLIRSYPDALERRDGKTLLYPFMQASAITQQKHVVMDPKEELRRLSVVYDLMRMDPSLVRIWD